MRASIRPVHGLGKYCRLARSSSGHRWPVAIATRVDNYRVCCTIGVDGDPGGLNRNIRNFTGFTNANHKADVPGPLNEVQKTVAIVFAEDNPRQKLALMQGVTFKPARRQPVIALLLQPLQVGQVDGGSQCWQYWPAFAPRYYRHCRAYPPRPAPLFQTE